GDLAIDWDYDTITGGPLPPRPSFRPGSPRLVLSAARHPRRIGPLLGLSAAVPTGRGSLEPIRGAGGPWRRTTARASGACSGVTSPPTCRRRSSRRAPSRLGTRR